MARPEGVRIERPDGTLVPCELHHRGYDPDEDMDNWDIVTEVAFRPNVDKLLIAVFPPRTGLGFRVKWPTQ
jgi:hypothetical protein